MVLSNPSWRKHLEELGRKTVTTGDDWVDKSFAWAQKPEVQVSALNMMFQTQTISSLHQSVGYIGW